MNDPQVKAMTDIADKIINEIGRDQMEVDVVNACMLVVQLICDRSESLILGEVAAGGALQLGHHLLKTSVGRQVLAARILTVDSSGGSEPGEPGPVVH